MNFLISFCLNNRITVILLTLALAVISIFVVKNTMGASPGESGALVR